VRGNKAGSSGLAPVVAPRASWSLTLGLIVATLREWRRRHVGRRELAKCDKRRCATSASILASSTTRCASRSGGPLAIGEIDGRGGEPKGRHNGSGDRPRTEDFRLWEPVGSEGGDVLSGRLPLLAVTPPRSPRECQFRGAGKAIAKPTTAKQ
jgi:hypothetical protein